ncbi:DUF6113 family protein [Streptomyces sp. NPDC000594]|uniref:DUF6113 family protein n=1 Tax=Streptomyces sp. NPDC000594 TaxID=3154261 RepID=UPI003325D815
MSGTTTPGAGAVRPARAVRPATVAAWLLLAVLGAAVGVAGSLVQGAWFPGGLLLALLGTTGLFLGAGRALGGQLPVVAAAVGWLITVVLLSMGRPEGDGVLAAGIGSILYLIGGMVLAVMCATMARPAQPGDTPARLDR